MKTPKPKPQSFDIYRTGSDQKVAVGLWLEGRGPSHAEWLADDNENCSVCAAISQLATDSSLASVTAHECLYEVRRAKQVSA